MAHSADQILDAVDRWPLSKSLAKTLRWAESNGETEFARWVRLESIGYWNANPVMTTDTVVPQYRTVDGQWFDEYDRALVISDPKLAFINQTRLRLGVAELEGFVGVKGVLALAIPEGAALIEEHLAVSVSTFRFDPRSVSQVITSIRVRLVDELARRPRIAQLDVPPATQVDDEIIELRPNVAGIGINLRALWRSWRSWSRD